MHPCPVAGVRFGTAFCIDGVWQQLHLAVACAPNPFL